jgi:hypothetical protein
MLFCDVLRWPCVEIHAVGCKDVVRARGKKLQCGTVEGSNAEDAISAHIRDCEQSGINFTRDCYRVMPCIRRENDARNEK